MYSPEAGKVALEALGPEIAGIGDTEIGNLRVDVEGATYAALGVAGFGGAPEVEVRFARLPEEEFDMSVVTGLESACFATYGLRADVVKGDQKHYRPADAGRARELAGILIQALSAAFPGLPVP